MKKLILLGTHIQRDIWLGEAAMAGAKVSATGLRVTRINGNEEQGVIVSGDERCVLQWLRGQVYDEYDTSRCHPLPGGELQRALDACVRKT